jgi:hypothetical protein
VNISGTVGSGFFMSCAPTTPAPIATNATKAKQRIALAFMVFLPFSC